MSVLEHYLNNLREHLKLEGAVEVAINADGSIWTETRGRTGMHRTNDQLNKQQVQDLAQQVANSTDNRFTDKAPILSAAVKHEDLSLRVQAVQPPAVASGTIVSIRVFREGERREPFKFKYLRDVKTSLEKDRAEKLQSIIASIDEGDEDSLLQALVSEKMNIIVSGGTNAGKTELGRRLLWMIPDTERIVTIEDSLELLPGQPNVVSLIANRDDGSPRSSDKLLQASLRLRPDRIIVGELRGIEAVTFLDAINTGHEGSFTTIHANTARKALDRLALMVLATGTQLTFDQVKLYLQDSIDVIIQTGRDDGDPGIKEVFFPGLDSAAT